jgi:O-antigen ligase
MATTNLPISVPKTKTRGWLRVAFWILALGIASLLFAGLRIGGVILWDDPTLLVVCSLLLVALFVVLSRTRAQSSDPRKSFFMIAVTISWFVLVSEQLFYHPLNTLGHAVQGNFGTQAYQEAASWVFSLFLLAAMSIMHPQYLRRMFSGCYKWASIFAILALASVPLSPSRAYSFAWALKLVTVVLLLAACLATDRSVDGIKSFYRAMLWGFVVLAVIPLLRILTLPDTAFSQFSDVGGRLAVSTNGYSTTCGILILMSLMLFALQRRFWLILFAVTGVTMMILSGGKAGIVSGIVSIVLYFLFQKRIVASIAVLLGIAILGSLLLVATPLGRYFSNYERSGEASTLTGRTDLWQETLPEIKQHLVLGHGYVASKFLSAEMDTPFEAPHLHNGFLEVLYNNGLPGLLLILLMHFSILKNLAAVSRRPSSREFHLLAVGSLAIYFDILFTGQFNVSFGGHLNSPFIVFLALILIGENLKRANSSLVAEQTS